MSDTIDRELGDADAPEHLSMGIDPYERNWMRASVLLLVVFFASRWTSGEAPQPGSRPES